MGAKPQDEKGELIQKVLAHARAKLPADQAAVAEAFIGRYYGWCAPDDLIDRSVVDLYGAAVAQLRFAHHRPSGTPRVRVYTPQLEDHGWQSTHTIVEIVTDNMPFIVDSTSMELNRHGYGIHLVIHPVVVVRRDEGGRLVEVLGSEMIGPDDLEEAYIHVEIERQSDPKALDELRVDLERVLANVRASVEDWAQMRDQARVIASDLEAGVVGVDAEEQAEARAFTGWLADDHFTFLGYRDYELLHQDGEDVLRPISGSGLGILRGASPQAHSRSFAQLPPEARRRARDPHLLNLTKANSKATVHRPIYLDYVGVRRLDETGTVIGERRFLGLYTSTVYSASPFDIPVLRRKVRGVLQRAGFPPASHSGKDLVAVLETYPRDELFQVSEDDLLEISMGILELQERQRVRLFIRRDDFGRLFSCLVYLPRDRYTTSVREQIQEILMHAFGGVSVEFTARISESVLARLHVVVHTEAGSIVDYDGRAIEAQLAEAARSWTDDLYQAVIDQCGEDRGVPLFHRYRDAFPASYRDDFTALQAVTDMQRLDGLDADGDLAISLSRPLESPPGSLRFKLFRSGGPIALSDVLPLLEHMGVRVIDERPYEIKITGQARQWIYEFGLSYDGRAELETDRVKEIFQQSFARAWTGAVEDDGFNRLVLGAGLTWREISVLRGYSKYLRQIGTTFSQVYIEQSLAAHPEIARMLVELFVARFDPEGQAPSAPAAQSQGATAPAETNRLDAEIELALDAVASLDEDRILRSFLHLIRATLRTNFFQPDGGGDAGEVLAFKLDPAAIPDLPLPRPMFEIFVYSPRVEGVHLRGGQVARGGIRWSDRREDFRTEILGLMKAQTVKNAVIVPVGAKGGFVVKRPPTGDRAALAAEVEACYRIFVSGLLDLTDNLVAGQIVPPPATVRYDGDDPYLVLAADKGTASFSDVANELSQDRGFWLGDAFASGGSAGYDHKRMGITARGAWESVTRHLHEEGIDPDTTDFTVVGIGDMSGDVFGNGMMLSRHIKLVAAFDHRHVFVDPDPDAAAGFAERTRLFQLPGSSWGDYDTSLLSPGGGVYPRTAKSIALSPEARRALAVDDDALTPNEMIRGVLRSPVDLLWNGGVGTYVKARTESHADAGDKTCDPVRVNGHELRCRVVGEGGNLGFTQRGRIEYALAGGRINTDAIDNSAGVDCSDHEVNIKILLDAVMADGDLTTKQRNTLLAEMTDEVAALVLQDNYAQNQALANARMQSAPMADVHARYIRWLEQQGRLDRAIEFLPGEEELSERMASGQGLTSPELAVLLAYTKIFIYDELLSSGVSDDPYLKAELARYFPSRLRTDFADRMPDHRLRREIVATCVTNGLVNEAGISFAYRLQEETGATVADVVRAHTVAREVFALPELWAEIEELGNQVAADTQTALLLEGRKLVERATRWLLRNGRRPLDIAAMVAAFGEATARLAARLPDLLVGQDSRTLEAKASDLAAAGVPAPLARRVAGFGPLFSALDINEVARATGESVEDVGGVYFEVADRLRLDWLRDRIVALPRDDRWQALARDALREDLYSDHRALAANILRAEQGREASADRRVANWLESNNTAAGRCLQVLADIEAATPTDVTTLSVALRQIRDLIMACGPSGTVAI